MVQQWGNKIAFTEGPALDEAKKLQEQLHQWWERYYYCALSGEKMMSHEFPRRRDVRAVCEEVFNVLLENRDYGKFNDEFLTIVRDLMRDGLPFADAVSASVEITDPEAVEFLC